MPGEWEPRHAALPAMNWNHLNLRTKLLLGVGILVTGYVVSVAVGFATGAVQERALAAVGQISVPVSLRCQSALFEFESSAKAFTDAIMTGEQDVLKDAVARNAKTAGIVEDITRLAAAAGLTATELSALRTQLAGLDAARAEVFKGMTTADAATKEAARKKAEVLTAGTDRLRLQLTQLSTAAAAQLDARLVETTARIRQQRFANLVLAAIVITLGCATLILIIQRAVMRPVSRVVASLGKTSQSVEAAAGTVRESGQHLADGASQQAASLEETSATLEEISSGAKSNAEHSQVAKQKASEACAAAARGTADIDTMRSAMNDIKAASDSIAKIVKTIDEIAFQTNLLALNAAIEAARAGEHGRGFAVVAGEVKNLAAESKSATGQIEDLIGSIQKHSDQTSSAIRASHQEIQAGIESVNRTIEALNRIITESNIVMQSMTGITKATDDLAQAITRVLAGVTQTGSFSRENQERMRDMAALAEETSAATEEIASASSELAEMAIQLKKIMEQFRK